MGSGFATRDARMSRLGRLALTVPALSSVASHEGSTTPFTAGFLPFTVGCDADTLGPPTWRTNVACDVIKASSMLLESAYEMSASPALPMRNCRKSPRLRSPC